jgi:signal transduction histidine kinase
LTSMRERTEALGGQFSVSSAPGEGTCVEVQLP